MTVSMKEMLEAGVHFGHQTRFWNPKMEPYIFGSRFKVHIINLEKTLPMFKDALKLASDVASKGGRILFVGTKDSAQEIIREEAERCSMPYVNHRWLGGMLTNYKTIRQSIRRLRDLETQFEHQAFEGLTKKERLTLEREFAKLELSLGGIKNMGGLPDLIFIVDVGIEKIAVQEANRLKIPVIGIVDTNNSPDNIDYLVPGNDDSYRSIRLYCKTLADTIIEARKNIVAEEEAKAKVKTVKTAKKEVKAKQKVVTKKAAETKESEKETKEKVAEEKTPAKKAAPKKKAEEKPKSTAKKDDAEKAPAKKAATKKPAAKKPAAKKTTATKAESDDKSE